MKKWLIPRRGFRKEIAALSLLSGAVLTFVRVAI